MTLTFLKMTSIYFAECPGVFICCLLTIRLSLCIFGETGALPSLWVVLDLILLSPQRLASTLSAEALLKPLSAPLQTGLCEEDFGAVTIPL